MTRPNAGRVAALGVIVAAGLATGRTPFPFPPVIQSPSSRPVRVLLASPRDEAPVHAGSPWALVDAQRRVIARGKTDDEWIVQRDGGRLRAMSGSGERSAWYDGPATLEPSDTSEFVIWDKRRYRGVLQYVPGDSLLFVVNKLDVEDYLRGVVPLEIGTKSTDEHAAVEPQAVTARGFTYTKMLYASRREFDLTASSSDQVYRGVDVENFIGDLALAATAGWVLSYAGRVIAAPYHSTCGGSTAEPSDLWRAGSEPFLQSVSDRVPGGTRFYCDISPRFRWDRTFSGEALSASLERYARAYANVPPGPLGAVRDIRVEERTPSGRARAIVITTEHVRLRIQGDNMRSVLRTVGGEILPSTYFSLEPASVGGRLAQLVIHGQGYGHGVGMCQWGAIGRARAGQDFRTILRAYYPGTDLVRAP